jgi:flavin reductase (DIM6/NTAB) family NADH-FMN oxidoreductase RutF
MAGVDQLPVNGVGVVPAPRQLQNGAAQIAHERRELREVLGRFATGVTVVTAGATVPHGMTANSFTSVSLEPPLVLVCVLREAAMHTTIVEGKAFAVSVLAADQEKEARYFADRGRPRDEREFAVVDASPGRHTGAPVLAGALAWMECRLAAVYDGGDHSIFLGEVVDLGRGPGAEALLFYGGGFHRLEPATG